MTRPTGAPARASRSHARFLFLVLFAACSLFGALLGASPQHALADVTTVSDDFNRANGSLGSDWTDMADGGMAISSDAVAGGNANGNTGDMWSANTFGSDQFSQIQLTGTQLTGGQWIGVTVRAQDGGADNYTGLYFWNYGNPELMLFSRSDGNWTELGGAVPTGPLPGGTVLELDASGSTISLLENGSQVITATDTSITGGAPGIMAFGTATGGDWTGGDLGSSGSGSGTPPVTYTVGGTVTGLTGTVVLEDNGGDNLTVSASGSFTFATSLAQGAAYDVTVGTEPAGQTCTITGGSGTMPAADITNIAVACSTLAAGSTASDDFNRADGSLGPNWTDMADGGMAISSDAVTGGNANGNTGDIWSASTFGSDQFSQIELTGTQLTGGQWIGATVRAQDGGQDGFTGLYFWNYGNPELMLFARSGGNWTQLGGSVPTGPLPGGTVLEVDASGSAISMLENGSQIITASDTSITGGAPGIMAFGTSQADNWTGGDLGGSGSGSGTPPATYTVGGTATGLTGTLVLQDNGGDNLTVSASGSFTFTTSLAQGAAYDVTVGTEPAGQTCTVAGGSGTMPAANITTVAVACTTLQSGSTASDDFNRADGSLGSNWTDMSDGGMAISSDAVTGGDATGNTGDMWSANTFGSDQFSQIELTGTQLSGGQWIGVTARAQDGGQDGYTGLYWWNNGNPLLMLFLRSGGQWTQLGGSVPTGPLPGGTLLELDASGSTISLLENGSQVITAADSTVTGGAPGIMAYGNATADNWSGGSLGSSGSGATTYTVGGTVTGLTGTLVLQDNGGDVLTVSASGSFTFATPLAQGAPYDVTIGTEPAGQTCTVAGGSGTMPAANITTVSVTCVEPSFSATYESTDANGIQTYDVISADNGPDPQEVRVLQPTDPAPGVAHNFLFVLPVEAGLGTDFGDGMETMYGLNAQNQYNLTIIEPTFELDPWYGNNPSVSYLQYETYMVDDLVPWVEANFSTTGHEQNWLIGFSKSGFGAQDLILKHPDVFSLAASWDFPADMSTYDEYCCDADTDFGTNANFQANYELTPAFLDAHKAPFLNSNRIWIGSGISFVQDVTDYDALLTSEGVEHSTEGPQTMTHSWDGGWVPLALAGLYQDSLNLGS
jgi:Putative esterase